MPTWTTPTAIHSKCGEEGSDPVSNFIDNSLSSFWAHDHDELHWVILDLGQSYSVSGVRTYVASSQSKSKWESVDVYVSDDPGNLGSAVATGLSFTSDGWNEHTFTAKTGRYVKLDGIDPQHAGNYLNGYEFDAYCEEVAGEGQPTMKRWHGIPSMNYTGRKGGW